MADRKTGLETAMWTANIAFLLVGIISTVFLLAKLAVPSFLALLALLSSSLLRLIITLHLIAAIIIICALHQHPQEDHSTNYKILDYFPPPPPLVRNLSREIWSHFPSFPLPSAEIWHDIPVDSGGNPPDNRDPPPSEREGDGHDTMDDTWKAIMDAKRVMKKSETSERRHRAAAQQGMEVKSEAFRDPARAVGVRKLLAGKDELFRQVEAFIKKNYEKGQIGEKLQRSN